MPLNTPQKLQQVHNVTYTLINAARFTYVTILLSKLHLFPLSFQCNSRCWLLPLTQPDYVQDPFLRISTCLTRSDKTGMRLVPSVKHCQLKGARNVFFLWQPLPCGILFPLNFHRPLPC